MAKHQTPQNMSLDFGDEVQVASGSTEVMGSARVGGPNSPPDDQGRKRVASGTAKTLQSERLVGGAVSHGANDSEQVAHDAVASPIGLQEGLSGSTEVRKIASIGADDSCAVPGGGVVGLSSPIEVVCDSGLGGTKVSPGVIGDSSGLKKSPKPTKGARSGRNQVFEINPNVVVGETLFDIDTPKRRNAGYRVRRDLLQERQVDMPLFITGIEIRSGIPEDDRHWNRKFNELREQITKEISDLRFVTGDRIAIEVTWNLPLNWPYVALRAPDGRRIVETDSSELGSYGLRSVTMLWKGIVEKQKAMQTMARNYAALLRWAEKLRTKVPVAMDGSRTSRLLLDPEIHKQINALEWPTYLRDTAGGPFSPLPFNVYEAMRVRLWAHVKAVKQHVHAMNLNYNRVTNEKRASLGKTRGAALAVAIMDGPARTPQHYWALWVRKGTENLFYKVVTPRFFSLERGKYITSESFPVSDERGRLATYAIDRCHLTHMKDLYRAADLVLADLLALSQKTADLIVETMGKRHGKESSAASGRGSWRGSGVLFRWIPGQ